MLINFLCATQDIADAWHEVPQLLDEVDGWALTMLRKENSNYQATCNAAGQTFGYALGFTGFTAACHGRLLPAGKALDQFKLLSLSGFMFAMGLCFLLVTVLVALIKPLRRAKKTGLAWSLGPRSPCHRKMNLKGSSMPICRCSACSPCGQCSCSS